MAQNPADSGKGGGEEVTDAKSNCQTEIPGAKGPL